MHGLVGCRIVHSRLALSRAHPASGCFRARLICKYPCRPRTLLVRQSTRYANLQKPAISPVSANTAFTTCFPHEPHAAQPVPGPVIRPTAPAKPKGYNRRCRPLILRPGQIHPIVNANLGIPTSSGNRSLRHCHLHIHEDSPFRRPDIFLRYILTNSALYYAHVLNSRLRQPNPSGSVSSTYTQCRISLLQSLRSVKLPHRSLGLPSTSFFKACVDTRHLLTWPKTNQLGSYIHSGTAKCESTILSQRTTRVGAIKSST